MIDIRNLHVHYQSSEGSVHAVRGINIKVEEGQFYTMLGPSGCGKTTTLRCLAGLERPRAVNIHQWRTGVLQQGAMSWYRPTSATSA